MISEQLSEYSQCFAGDYSVECAPKLVTNQPQHDLQKRSSLQAATVSAHWDHTLQRVKLALISGNMICRI